MFKRILVPLDGSEAAEVVMPFADFFIHALDAQVFLVHMIERKAPTQVHQMMHLQSSSAAEEYLEKAKQRFFSEHPHVQQHVHTLVVDDVAKSINDHTQELDCSLVIMAAHGNHSGTETMFGTMAQKVIARGRTPVLLVRSEYRHTVDELTITSILIPLDEKQEHRQGLELGENLAKKLHAQIHYVHVIPTFDSIAGNFLPVSRLLPGATKYLLDIQQEHAREYCEEKVRQMQDHGVTCTSAIKRGEPSKMIIQEADAMKSQLIILGTHGKKGISAFWAGSIAAKICLSSTIPILLIPQHKELSFQKKKSPP